MSKTHFRFFKMIRTVRCVNTLTEFLFSQLLLSMCCTRPYSYSIPGSYVCASILIPVYVHGTSRRGGSVRFLGGKIQYCLPVAENEIWLEAERGRKERVESGIEILLKNKHFGFS